MYHLIVMFVLCRLIEVYLPTGYYLIPLYFIGSFAGTIGISLLSYKLMESPLLTLKPKHGM
jgi:peptidoglycan/LPS O-acetylase OafA/YrhL